MERLAIEMERDEMRETRAKQQKRTKLSRDLNFFELLFFDFEHDFDPCSPGSQPQPTEHSSPDPAAATATHSASPSPPTPPNGRDRRE